MPFFRRMARNVGALLCTLAPTSCGEVQAPPPNVAHASTQAASVPVFLDTQGNQMANPLCTKMVGRLIQLGYAVADSPANARVIVTMALTVEQGRGAINLGTLQIPPTFNARATISAFGDGRILATETVVFDVKDGPSGEQVDQLLGAFTGRKLDAVVAPGAPTPIAQTLGLNNLLVCDGNECDKGNSAAWIFHGNVGVGRWVKGAVADLSVERADSRGLVIHRTERVNSPIAGLTAMYTGEQRNGRIEGQFVASWPGHFASIKGPWFAAIPRTSCDDSTDTRPQEFIDTGAMSLRFQQKHDAFSCFMGAAKQGDAQAKGLVGIMYRDGIGTASNPVEAVRWLNESAVQGDYNGQVALVQMYELGIGTKQDPHLAQYWRDAATQNPVYVQKQKDEARAERQQEIAQEHAHQDALQMRSLTFMGLAALMTSL